MFDFLKKIFSKHTKIEEEFYKELEETLIEADVGAKLSYEIIDELKKINPDSIEKAKEILKNKIGEFLKEGKLIKDDGLKVVIFSGVNGVGKTTSVAKLGFYLKQKGYKIKFVAADTYRAAGIEQLEILAKRVGAPVIKQKLGSDGAAVVFDGIDSALSDNCDYLLVDTAGRMHTREDLMNEIKKIFNVAQKKIKNTNIENIIVIDATVGQNGFNQAEMFKKYLNITGAFISKFDSIFKAGIVIRICKEIQIPIKFIGTGEKLTDIKEFSKEDFINKLF